MTWNNCRLNRMTGRVPKAMLIALGVALAVAGCAGESGPAAPVPTHTQYDSASPVEGEEAPFVASVYTTERQFALTFNGLAERAELQDILDELDKLGMKATFFVPGMRVAEEPDLVEEIIKRGHELENNTLTRSDPSKLTYTEVYKEIHLSKSVIEQHTDHQSAYVRTRTGDDLKTVRQAAAQSGIEAVIGYSLNLKDSHLDNELQQNSHYMRLYMTRGGIIDIDLERNDRALEMLPLIAASATEVGYRSVTLSVLMEGALPRRPAEEIVGYDLARINTQFEDAEYELVYAGEPDDKRVSITIDDWGTDYTVTRILDILKQYDVPVTFFLRANGVANNPSLGRAILEEGHEIANHTYTHPVLTELSADRLQEEIVTAHRVLTEAIQQAPVMLFRPPTGAIDDRSARIVAATGYRTIAMYDVTVLDWKVENDADTIVQGVMEQTVNGSVILLHMLDDIHTIEALPRIIEVLRDRGHSFAIMSDLINPLQND